MKTSQVNKGSVQPARSLLQKVYGNPKPVR
jgi:hypothetical protein